MTIRDDIFRVLRAHPHGLTDAELASRLGKRHQQINQRCRQLASDGVTVCDDSSGLIVNRLASAVGATSSANPPAVDQTSRPPAQLTHAQSEWSWEGNVQASVVAHLAREGWRVTRVADTAAQERGVDIVAERGGGILFIEVKGWPSRFYVRGERAGQLKPTQPTLQAKHWYADALLAALRLREKHPTHAIVIAFPDMPRYRALASETRSSVAASRVDVWFVAESGAVAFFATDGTT